MGQKPVNEPDLDAGQLGGTLRVNNGGTGAATASGARTNLGLPVVQAEGLVAQTAAGVFAALPVNRTQNANMTIPAGFSVVIAGGLTIASGVNLTIGAGGVLALI